MIDGVTDTYDFGYCPIVFVCNKTDEHYNQLVDLWKFAKDCTLRTYPEFMGHSWRIKNETERQLVFSSDNYGDANLFFWKTLKEKAGLNWNILKDYFQELSSEEVAEINSE